jgi:hypothetical protein
MKTVTRVTLTPAMARMLVGTEILKVNDVRGPLTTIVALIERGMALAGADNLVTDRGRRVARLIYTNADLYEWSQRGTGSRTLHIPAKENRS